MLIFIGLSVIRRHLSTKFYCTTGGSWGHNTPQLCILLLQLVYDNSSGNGTSLPPLGTGYLRFKIISTMTHITGVQRRYCL